MLDPLFVLWYATQSDLPEETPMEASMKKSMEQSMEKMLKLIFCSIRILPAIAPVKIGVLPLSKKLGEGAEKVGASCTVAAGNAKQL